MATTKTNPDHIISTDKGGIINLTAHDQCQARMTQARAIISLIEQEALQAAQDGERLTMPAKDLAEALWAARELLEQAQAENLRAYSAAPLVRVA